MNRCFGDMLSMAVMLPRSATVKALGFAPVTSAVRPVSRFGRLTRLAISRRRVARGEVAAAVRGGDEDDAAHERQRLHERHLANHLSLLVGHLHFFEGLVADGPPEPIAAVDDRHLRQQTALAVADHDHVAKARIATGRVHAVHRFAEVLPEQIGRIDDRTPGIVEEEPRLESRDGCAGRCRER